MVIPLRDLFKRLNDEGIESLAVRCLDDTPLWESVPRDELELLIGMGAVSGVGSYTKLRHLRLEIPLDELEDRRRDHNRTVGAERPHRELDFLARMMSSRKTTYLERINVWQEGGLHAVFIHQHKGVNLP